MAPSYLIHWTAPPPTELGAWDSPIWDRAEVLEVSHFHSRSSEHRPRTEVRVLHDGRAVLVRFDVDDRFVISRATEFQQSVCLDSCVEFFFRPEPAGGYFNIEINCGGTLLVTYIDDINAVQGTAKKITPLTPAHAERMTIYHSMPATVIPERTEATRWRIGCRFPISMLEDYVGKVGEVSGRDWAGNFYKCADRSSHPHWASWSAIGETLNFHQPKYFGHLRFE